MRFRRDNKSHHGNNLFESGSDSDLKMDLTQPGGNPREKKPPDKLVRWQTHVGDVHEDEEIEGNEGIDILRKIEDLGENHDSEEPKKSETSTRTKTTHKNSNNTGQLQNSEMLSCVETTKCEKSNSVISGNQHLTISDTFNTHQTNFGMTPVTPNSPQKQPLTTNMKKQVQARIDQLENQVNQQGPRIDQNQVNLSSTSPLPVFPAPVPVVEQPGPTAGPSSSVTSSRRSTSGTPDNGQPDAASEQPKETYAEKVLKKRQAMQHEGIKLHVYLDRSSKNVSYALTNVELGGLVRKLRVPKGNYVGCNDANEEGSLTLTLKADTDLSKLNLSVPINIRKDKLRTRPICPNPKAEVVTITRIPEGMKDEEIISVLALFGKIEGSMECGVVEPKVGEMHPDVLFIKGSIKWSERSVTMSLTENIPSKILVKFSELNVRYPSQKRTCARCKKIFTECLGEGNAATCQKRGGVRVELRDVWDRFIEGMKRPVVCIPTENLGDAAEVDYVEVSGLPYDYTNVEFMDLAARSGVGLMIEEISLEQSNTPGVFRINFHGTTAPREELQDIMSVLNGLQFNHLSDFVNARGNPETRLKSYKTRCLPITVLDKTKVQQKIQQVVDLGSSTDSDDRVAAFENELDNLPPRPADYKDKTSADEGDDPEIEVEVPKEKASTPKRDQNIANTLLARINNKLINTGPGPKGKKAKVIYGPAGTKIAVSEEQEVIQVSSTDNSFDVTHISPGDLANCDGKELGEVLANKAKRQILNTVDESSEEEDGGDMTKFAHDKDGQVVAIEGGSRPGPLVKGGPRPKNVAAKSTGGKNVKTSRKRNRPPTSSSEDGQSGTRRSDRIQESVVAKKSKNSYKTSKNAKRSEAGAGAEAGTKAEPGAGAEGQN